MNRYATIADLDRATVMDNFNQPMALIQRGGRHAFYMNGGKHCLIQANDSGHIFKIAVDLGRDLERAIPLYIENGRLWEDRANASRWQQLDATHRHVVESNMRQVPVPPRPIMRQAAIPARPVMQQAAHPGAHHDGQQRGNGVFGNPRVPAPRYRFG